MWRSNYSKVDTMYLIHPFPSGRFLSPTFFSLIKQGTCYEWCLSQLIIQLAEKLVDIPGMAFRSGFLMQNELTCRSNLFLSICWTEYAIHLFFRTGFLMQNILQIQYVKFIYHLNTSIPLLVSIISYLNKLKIWSIHKGSFAGQKQM